MSAEGRGSFQFIDHTADVGIRVSAATLEGVFETAGLAFAELVTSTDSLEYRVERQFNLQEDDIETLLVSWLQELLYLLDTEGYVFGRFQVKLQNSSLAPVDHLAIGLEMRSEIKAVTYHQLEVIQSDEGWQAQVIFDI